MTKTLTAGGPAGRQVSSWTRGDDMTLLRCVILLQFTAILALGQVARQSKPPGVHKQPEAMVRSLYREVVARHPIGIPEGANMKVFAPYLSKALLHRTDLALACGKDWYRQYPDPSLKPEIAWLEFGLFSGGNEKVSPRAFHVERTQSEEDGSFRVHVRLTWGPPSNLWIWRVAAIVVQENGHLAVDDVIFLKDERTLDDGSSLSEILALGCDGPRWVGHGRPTLPHYFYSVPLLFNDAKEETSVYNLRSFSKSQWKSWLKLHYLHHIRFPEVL